MSDENNNENKKRIELWDGYWVDFDENLADDFDFINEFKEVTEKGDLSEFATMCFALVGGEKAYEDTRKHLIEIDGRVSFKAMDNILTKICNCLPKAGNRAQRRSR